MRFTFKLLDSQKDIQQKILKAMLSQVSSIIDDAISKIKNNLPTIISQNIINSPEYSSLLSGKLKYEFGIPNPDSKLASLIDVWSTNILYTYQKPFISGTKIKSTFSANMIRADFSDVLYSDFAAVVDIARGYSLPWLEWLLLEGNKTIIKNYEVKIGPSRSSRTGYALMKPSTKSWKVPSEFSGTFSDNWITRAIDKAAPQIETLLDGVFS